MPSLYLHIPFCEHKCLYCDFYSIAPNEDREGYGVLVNGFLKALEFEIDMRSAEGRFRGPFETMFFGGGTPSLLEPSTIQNILCRLAARFGLEPDAEITVETNPGTVDVAKLRAYREAGVNRLSIGIQSFFDDDLKFLSRIHSAVQAKQCVQDAYRAGFENVSLDLIFALPSQTTARWRRNLEQAVELAPTHISAYSLIVEPNTPLHRLVVSKQVTLPPPETDASMYEETIDFLGERGYVQYEVSNFARPGYRSRHNCNYWNHAPYLGFGPSAHSFWEGRRWWNVANVGGYCDALNDGRFPVAGEETLTEQQLREEEIFLGLRSDGVDVAGFRRRHRIDLLRERGEVIDRLVRDRLAVLEGDYFRLTAKGYAVCDEISAQLL